MIRTQTTQPTSDDTILDWTPLPAGSTFKVLFVYPNCYELSAKPLHQLQVPQVGLTVLSACVKKIGAESRLCNLTNIPLHLCEQVLFGDIKSYQPDLVAMTASSNQWTLASRLVRLCKQLGVAHVVGGPHASVSPDEVLTGSDLLVLGEGEGALLDIVRAMGAGRSPAGIANTWFRSPDGHVVQRERRSLIRNLDESPLPDWMLFDASCYMRSQTPWCLNKGEVPGVFVQATLEASRGCPYQCTYCSNMSLARSYQGKGKWRREKSSTRLIQELLDFKNKLGGLHYVGWIDDIFITRDETLSEFCRAYATWVCVPFEISERPEQVTDERVRQLADAGLRGIAMGVESGDESFRKKVLRRTMSNQQIQRAFDVARHYGIKRFAYNMVGLPGQSEKSLLQTWKLLRRIRPDGAQFTFFHPKRGTVLYEECVKEGFYCPQQDDAPYQFRPVIRHDLHDDATLIRYQKMLTRYAAIPGFRSSIAFHLGRRWNWLSNWLEPAIRRYTTLKRKNHKRV